jgi:hypothetical protein
MDTIYNLVKLCIPKLTRMIHTVVNKSNNYTQFGFFKF